MSLCARSERERSSTLVVNPITVGNCAFLFNCTPVGRTSDSMTVPTFNTYLLMRWQGPDALADARLTGVYLLDFFCSRVQFYLLLSPYVLLSLLKDFIS